MEALWQDLRYALRMLHKSPGFAAVVVLTLALGIGVNTAIFTLCDLSFRPLPVKDPASVVQLRRGSERTRFSFPDYVYYRDQAQTFSGLIAFIDERLVLAEPGGTAEPRRIEGTFVSDNFFSVLGGNTAFGRTFTPEENSAPGRGPVVVLGYAFWQGHFGSDPEVLGKTLWLNGQSFQVIGVTARDFVGLGWGLNIPDVWLPLMMRADSSAGATQWLNARSVASLFLFGRLKPGRTLAEARSEMTLLFSQLSRAYPEIDPKESVRVFPANLTGQGTAEALAGSGIVLVASGMVLLIACANLANLLLARGAARQKEIGLRLCLGANRWRVIRQLLTESLLLAGLGGVAGLTLAWWSLKATVPLWPEGRALIALNLDPDVRVFIYAFVLSLLTAIAFGLAPALRSTSGGLTATLKDQGASFGRSITRSRLRSGLVIAQVSLGLVLLIAAGLLLRGLGRLANIDPGFETQKVVVADLKLEAARYNEARAQQFYQDFAVRLRAMPGVQSVSRVSRFPLNGTLTTTITMAGETTAERRSLRVGFNEVTPDYFDTVGLPIVRGRKFTEEEMRAGAAVAVITESTALQLWPNQDPVGKLLQTKPDAAFSQVIGVARDAQISRLGEIDPLFIYLPFDARSNIDLGVLVRTSRDAKEMAPLVRVAARALDPTLFLQTSSMEERTASSELVRSARGASVISAGLGLLALLLAALGLYGVIAYSVAQRTHEIGIRMALGASRRNVVWLVLGQGMRLVGIGIALGVAGGTALSRALSAWLFGLSPFDPIAYATVSLFLVVVALVACYIPARRATKVDPLVALHYE